MNLRDKIQTEINFPNSIFTGQRTYSSLFLAPAFDLIFDSELTKYFVNTYIDDCGIKHSYQRPLFVLLQTKQIDSSFKNVEEDLMKKKTFKYTYCAGINNNSFLYMYVFECSDEYKDDYDKFIKGLYSKFSIKYKSKFAKTVENLDGKFIESPLYGVIYKTPSLKRDVERIIFVNPTEKLDKEQEYFGKPDRKIEVFRHE